MELPTDTPPKINADDDAFAEQAVPSHGISLSRNLR